jgi:hypothetical protein
MNKASKYFAILLLLVILVGFINLTPQVFADVNEGNSGGQVTIGTAEASVTSDMLLNTADISVNSSVLDVKTEYWINATIHSASTMNAITSLEFDVWDSSRGTQGTAAENNSYNFTMAGPADTWTSSPSGYVMPEDCVASNSDTVSDFTFRCAFNLSGVAHEEPASVWKVAVKVSTSVGSNELSDLGFGLAYYSQVTAIDSTHDFGTLNPGDTNRSLATPANYITINWLANNASKFQIKGSGDLNRTATPYHTIGLSNVVAKGAAGTSGAAALSTDYTDLPSGGNKPPQSEEGSPGADPIYLWITVPAVCLPGTYAYTLYVQAIKELEGPSIGLNLVANVANLIVLTPCEKSVLRTSDGTIHILTMDSSNGHLFLYHSWDNGAHWTNDTIWEWHGWDASMAKDSNDNINIAFIQGNSGSRQAIFRKLAVNKSGTPWTWTMETQKLVSTTGNPGTCDIEVDDNDIIHIVFDSNGVGICHWDKSLNGGANWDENSICNSGTVNPTIIKDSLNNLYVISIQTDDWIAGQKITYNGGTSWTIEDPVWISQLENEVVSLSILPDDRLVITYARWYLPEHSTWSLKFRKATNPRDITAWNTEISIAINTELSDTSAYGSIMIDKFYFIRVFFHNQDNKLCYRESQDGGATFGDITIVYPALSNTSNINVAKDGYSTFNDFAFRVGTSQIYWGTLNVPEPE